jgi:hypothetical protein
MLAAKASLPETMLAAGVVEEAGELLAAKASLPETMLVAKVSLPETMLVAKVSLPETMLAAGAVEEAGEQMPTEAFPNAPESAPVASAANEAATDGLTVPRPQPLQVGNAADPNAVTTVHDLEAPAESELPVVVRSSSPQLEVSAEPARISQPPELAAQVRAMSEGSSVSVTRASSADANTLALAEGAAEPKGETAPVQSTDANQADSVQSGLANTQARGERVLIVAQRETQQDGNDSARDSGEKSFPGNLVRSHAIRAPRIVNSFNNSLSRVSSRAELTQSVIDQTVRNVLLSVRDGSSELRVRLKPEHLGELHLRVLFKDNVLHLDVSTQSTVVKSVIESNISQLRQSLDNSGFDTGKLSVTVDPDLSSGGHSSRQAHAFEPSENDWGATYRGHHADEEMAADAASRIARMRYAVSQLDLIA